MVYGFPRSNWKDLYTSVPKNRWPGRLCRRETTWDHRRPLPKQCYVSTTACVWPVFGCMHHGHMMVWHNHCDICDAWICEGVIYHTPRGISSFMTTYGSPISSLIRYLYPSFRTVIDTISTLNILNDLKVAYINSSKKDCIQEHQQ
jgi:hypothetical protein